MKHKFVFLMAVALLTITPVAVSATSTQQSTCPKVQQNSQAKPKIYFDANALDIVKSPDEYLNTNVKINAIFDKFSIVGLDYKPAFRSSQDYILFLIKKEEIAGHTIPLAEMKIFIKRSEAEKHIDLSSGDAIEFRGTVFSTALGDPWIEVDSLTLVKKKEKPKIIEK